MASLNAFDVTLEMSPHEQTLFNIEPLEFFLDSLTFGDNDFDVVAQSLVSGEFFLLRANFSLASETEVVIHGFDLFNTDGSLAASASGLDFSLAGPIDPFVVGLGAFLTGDDQFFGADGNDVIFGGSGDDTIDGGAGTDGAVYLGSRDQYLVEQLGAGVQVSDLVGGRDGVDLVSNIELFEFSIGLYSLSGLLAPDDVPDGVYRFFNGNSNTHFFTASAEERDAVLEFADGFVFEGPAFKAVDASDPGADPVFRFFNTDTGVHFYTISADERDSIVANLPQFVLEGEAYFAHDTAEAGTIPLFRFFNTATGTHFYSASEEERDAIIESLPEFNFEGTAYFVEGIA